MPIKFCNLVFKTMFNKLKNDQQVAGERKKELIDQILQVLGEFFFEQTTVIKKSIQQELNQKLNSIKIESGNIEILKDKLKKVSAEIDEKLRAYVEATKMDQFNDKLSLIYNECKSLLSDIMLAYREKQLNAVVKKLFMQKKRKIEGNISQLFNDLDTNFWLALGEANQNIFKELEDLLRFSLADVFELDSRTIENNIDNVRDEFKREIEIIFQ